MKVLNTLLAMTVSAAMTLSLPQPAAAQSPNGFVPGQDSTPSRAEAQAQQAAEAERILNERKEAKKKKNSKTNSSAGKNQTNSTATTNSGNGDARNPSANPAPAPVMAPGTSSPESDARFAPLDFNRDGLLNRDEFAAWQQRQPGAAIINGNTGVPGNPNARAAAPGSQPLPLEALDMDRDGQINRAEFAQWYHSPQVRGDASRPRN